MDKKYQVNQFGGISTEIATVSEPKEIVLRTLIPRELHQQEEKILSDWIRRNNSRMKAVCNFLNAWED